MFESLFKYSREDYARGEIVFINDWPEWLLYALVVVAVIAVAAGLYRRRSHASTFVLLSIGMLQLAMIAVVMFILLQPTLSSQVMRDGENSVALALDNSASMAHGLTESRFVAARQNLNNAIQADTLQNLSLRHYELGDSAELVDSFLSSIPTENATSMAGGLLRILDEARFSPLAAVVLASDGADTNGGLSADELAEIAAFGVPIHTIGVGREAMPEDIELSNVTVPDNSLPGSTVSARVTIRHDQAANARIKV
ncbi:MAG: vWA domain-containing protein, partial [Woeseiales bacterium]